MLFHPAGAEGMNLSPLFGYNDSSALGMKQRLFASGERPELGVATLYRCI
jgi:hypothetical protein